MPPAFEVLLLNTAVPQIQAAQAGDTYVVPRDIAFSAALTLSAGTANGVPYLNGSKVLTTGSALSFDGTNLGVGALNTNALLTLSGDKTAFRVERGSAIGFAYNTGTAATDSFRIQSNAGPVDIYTASGQPITFSAGAAEQMRLTSTGLGIGTSSPQTQLELSSNNGAGTALNILRFNDADTTSSPDQPTGKIEFYINDATAGGTGVASYIMGHAVNTAGGGYLTFATSPNGATGAIERLRIEFNGGLITKPAANGHAVFNEDGVDADFRVESDTNTHAFFVQGSDGFVGIGTSSPTEKLNIVGGDVLIGTDSGSAFNGDAFLRIQGSSNAYIGIKAGTAASAGILFGDTDDSFVGGMQYSNTDDALFFNANNAERLRITNAGSVSIGGTANRATTVGTKALNIFDGTAPVGTLANGISIYSSSGEAYVMDAAGNATLFSPHDAETNEWIFRSKHTPTGKVLKIDVERLLKFVNDHFGLDAVHEFIED